VTEGKTTFEGVQNSRDRVRVGPTRLASCLSGGLSRGEPETYSRLCFEECDVSKSLRFDDQTFDAVFANDVLCHAPGRYPVLRELCRVLKSGGRNPVQ
jgi:ubiquinone/menaquinone biosynthesis C-methylase UbiE